MKSISIYGMSMGTVFAALAAKYIGEIDNVILCSPAHVAFEGCEDDKHVYDEKARCKYEKNYKLLLYPYASHLISVMPNKDRNKWLYRVVPLSV